MYRNINFVKNYYLLKVRNLNNYNNKGRKKIDLPFRTFLDSSQPIT